MLLNFLVDNKRDICDRPIYITCFHLACNILHAYIVIVTSQGIAASYRSQDQFFFLKQKFAFSVFVGSFDGYNESYIYIHAFGKSSIISDKFCDHFLKMSYGSTQSTL